MLTDRQEIYVQELLNGKSQRQAYRIAYPKSKKWKDSTIDSRASKLFKDDKVTQKKMIKHMLMHIS